MMRRRLQAGISLIEIVIVLAIMGILLSVAGPKLIEMLSGAQDSAAQQNIHAIHTAQAAYFSKFGRFAENLAQLGPPAAGSARGLQAAGLLPPDLAAGEKGGYRYQLAPSAEGYALTARPSPPQGGRSFYTDGTMTVRFAPGTAEANAESAVLN